MVPKQCNVNSSMVPFTLISDCPLGTYGGNCYSNCSGYCKGANRFACNYIDGSCYNGCVDGWKGPTCNNGITLTNVNCC